MPPVRMVPVTETATPFEAQVIAARLGAAGLLWELRGNVGGPFALGPVAVFVAEDDASIAKELLLADEVESAFDDYAEGDETTTTGIAPWLVAAAIAFAIVFTFARIASGY